MKIFKYPLNYERIPNKGAEWKHLQIVKLPFGSEILRADFQNNTVVLWAKVNPYADKIVDYQIEIVGTGDEIEHPDACYVNTFFDGGLVLHVLAKLLPDVYRIQS